MTTTMVMTLICSHDNDGKLLPLSFCWTRYIAKENWSLFNLPDAFVSHKFLVTPKRRSIRTTTTTTTGLPTINNPGKKDKTKQGRRQYRHDNYSTYGRHSTDLTPQKQLQRNPLARCEPERAAAVPTGEKCPWRRLRWGIRLRPCRTLQTSRRKTLAPVPWWRSWPCRESVGFKIISKFNIFFYHLKKTLETLQNIWTIICKPSNVNKSDTAKYE